MMSIDEIVGIARKAKSLLHRDEMVYLCQLAQMAPDGLGVEVGVYCGASLIAWTLARNGRGASIGVDNWSYQDEYIDKFIVKGNEHNSLRVDGLKGVCEMNLATANVAAQLIDGNSADIAGQVAGDLAFVFIDGDHTSPAIDNDIAAWTPKIQPGGIVAFHDYGRKKNGCNVTWAVNQWVERKHWWKIGQVETMIGYRRPADK